MEGSPQAANPPVFGPNLPDGGISQGIQEEVNVPKDAKESTSKEFTKRLS